MVPRTSFPTPSRFGSERPRVTSPRSSAGTRAAALVVVARDAARHAWQEADGCGSRRASPRPRSSSKPGFPGDPPDVAAFIVTRGAGRANLEAMAAATR